MLDIFLRSYFRPKTEKKAKWMETSMLHIYIQTNIIDLKPGSGGFKSGKSESIVIFPVLLYKMTF